MYISLSGFSGKMEWFESFSMGFLSCMEFIKCEETGCIPDGSCNSFKLNVHMCEHVCVCLFQTLWKYLV